MTNERNDHPAGVPPVVGVAAWQAARDALMAREKAHMREGDAIAEFMGYTEPWYSARGLDWPVGEDMGPVACFLRDGDGVFFTYATVSRGTEVAAGVFALLDMTPYGAKRGRTHRWGGPRATTPAGSGAPTPTEWRRGGPLDGRSRNGPGPGRHRSSTGPGNHH